MRGDFRCPTCPLSLTDVQLPVYHVCRGDRVTIKAESLRFSECINRGDLLERITCRGCGSRGVEVDVYACSVHGRCHLTRANDNRAGMDCRLCAIAGEGFVSRETT